VGLQRLTIQPASLPSGIVIPAGYNVAINLKAIHHNPDVYPNPEVFDPFRFSRLRDDEGGDVKWGFTNVDRNVRGVSPDVE
jgi:cytochrome P450